jgi:hypothetical protein
MRDMGLKSAQDQISVHLAGMAMHRLMGSDISQGYEKDYRNVWKIAFDAFPHWADAIKAVNAAERKIDRLVRDVAPGAMLLGAELYKRGRLNHQEIDDILGRSVTRIKEPNPFMALDKQRQILAMDQRRIDHDGRMHVDVSNISKANVCPYRGGEIPYAYQLGLDPNKVYMLLRHPDELQKAADSFNGLPVLAEHVPVTADDHLPYLVIGSTGTRAKFEAPYLRNAISLWTREAIDAVKSGGRKQLSCAYSYFPDMEPGVYQGQHYDGVMRDLRGNQERR